MSSCKKKNPSPLLTSDWTQHRGFELKQTCIVLLNVPSESSFVNLYSTRNHNRSYHSLIGALYSWSACPVSYKPVWIKVVLTTHNVATRQKTGSLTDWRGPPVVQRALKGPLLTPAEHGGVNGNLHSPLAAQLHPFLLAHHLTLVLVWKWGGKLEWMSPKKKKKKAKWQQTPASSGKVRNPDTASKSHDSVGVL